MADQIIRRNCSIGCKVTEGELEKIEEWCQANGIDKSTATRELWMERLNAGLGAEMREIKKLTVQVAAFEEFVARAMEGSLRDENFSAEDLLKLRTTVRERVLGRSQEHGG